jgi:hypothetical protein
MKRIALGVLALLLSAHCVPAPPNVCSEQANAESWIGVFDFGEWGTAQDRLIADTTDGGVLWHASSRMSGGRIYLTLHPSVASGVLPRTVTSSAGCPLVDRFKYRDDADGKLRPGAVTITVLDGGQLGSTDLDFQLSTMSYQLVDGGTVALPDRRLTLSF